MSPKYIRAFDDSPPTWGCGLLSPSDSAIPLMSSLSGPRVPASPFLKQDTKHQTEHDHRGKPECRELASLTVPAASRTARGESPGWKPRVLVEARPRRSLISGMWHIHTWSMYSPQSQPALPDGHCCSLVQARLSTQHSGDPPHTSIFPEDGPWKLPKRGAAARSQMRTLTRHSFHLTGVTAEQKPALSGQGSQPTGSGSAGPG